LLNVNTFRLLNQKHVAASRNNKHTGSNYFKTFINPRAPARFLWKSVNEYSVAQFCNASYPKYFLNMMSASFEKDNMSNSPEHQISCTNKQRTEIRALNLD